jgi:hypothetical protein
LEGSLCLEYGKWVVIGVILSVSFYHTLYKEILKAKYPETAKRNFTLYMILMWGTIIGFMIAVDNTITQSIIQFISFILFILITLITGKN